MFLERLELTDFRNYESLTLEFTEPLCILAGQNAQGKTNILEAILLLAVTRSPRTSSDQEMVRWGAREAVVRAEVRRSQRPPVSLSLAVRRDGSKQGRIDAQPVRRVAEVIGQLVAVVFLPGDLDLVAGAPGGRRAFLNACLGQTSPAYLAALAHYRVVLRQRNALLKQALDRPVDDTLLETYDAQLAEQAGILMAARHHRIADLGREAGEVHQRLAGGHEMLSVTYQPDVPLPDGEVDAAACAGQVAEHLVARRDQERRRGVTLVGPHRDDLRLGIDQQPARRFASQGQQRTAALALKIAELRVTHQVLGESPILLLDDVMSELDDHRRGEVMALTDEAEQVMITCSQASTFDAAFLRRAGLYRVVAGTVETVATQAE